MQRQNIESLFRPKSVAIIGASDKPGKVGTVIAENVANLGYEGEVYFVNPTRVELHGRRCYGSLGEIGSDVDLAIIALPAQAVLEVVREGADIVKNYVIISAGFAETGEDGRRREEELSKLAAEKGLNILGPNCLGFIVPALSLNASFAGGMPEAGNIAFISQSGALAVAIMDIAKEQSLKFSHLVSVGNKMQLDEAELLSYLENDDSTKVIGMYVEGIKDGAAFIEAATRVSAKKPIVILKAGKTDKAQKAISSHTGALAGSDVIMDVVFSKAGVIRAQTLDEFFAFIKLMSFAEPPADASVAVVTNAGGVGVLTTDAFQGKSVALAEIPAQMKTSMEAGLPAEASAANPVDVLGDAQEDRYSSVLRILEGGDMGTVVCVLTPQDQTPVARIADEIIDFGKRTDKTVATIFVGGERIGESVGLLQASGVPNFTYPEQAIMALDEYYKWGVRRKNLSPAKHSAQADRKSRTNEVIATAKLAGKKALLFAEAATVMRSYGIQPVPSYDVSEGMPIPADIDYPVVAKVDSDTVLHKTDRQGLILNIKSKETLEEAIRIINSNFPGEKIIAQPMRDKHAEIILGITRDSVFGPIIAFGLGGIYTEVFKMVDFLVPPMEKDAIVEAIRSSKIAYLFEGVRGQAPCDIDEFADILKGLADFALEAEGVGEFDINPLFVYNDGRLSVAVDIKIILD